MVYILRVDSRNQVAGSVSNTNFSTNTLPLHVHAVRIKQIIIPNLFPNIRASPSTDANSTFSYESGGTPATIVVPTGFYSLSDLLTYLTTALTALSITFVEDGNTGLITLTNGGAATFQVLNTAGGNSMANVLGIKTDVLVNPAGTTVFENIPNLFNHSIIYVASNKLSNSFNMISSEQRLNIIASIPVNVAFGANIIYEPNEQHSIVFEEGYNIEDIDIQVVNHYGEVLTLPTNHHIQILVECERHNHVA